MPKFNVDANPSPPSWFGFVGWALITVFAVIAFVQCSNNENNGSTSTSNIESMK